MIQRRTRKRNVTATSFRIQPDVMEKLKAASEREDRSMTAIIHRALVAYLEKSNEHQH